MQSEPAFYLRVTFITYSTYSLQMQLFFLSCLDLLLHFCSIRWAYVRETYIKTTCRRTRQQPCIRSWHQSNHCFYSTLPTSSHHSSRAEIQKKSLHFNCVFLSLAAITGNRKATTFIVIHLTVKGRIRLLFLDAFSCIYPVFISSRRASHFTDPRGT